MAKAEDVFAFQAGHRPRLKDMILKFDKLIFIKDLVKLLITELFLVAVVAIIRIPLSSLVVTTIVTVGIAELLAFNIQNEKIIKRNKEKEENE